MWQKLELPPVLLSLSSWSLCFVYDSQRWPGNSSHPDLAPFPLCSFILDCINATNTSNCLTSGWSLPHKLSLSTKHTL